MFFHLISPRVCFVCKQTLTAQEDILCLRCSLDMPRTGLHRLSFNAIHQRLGHNCPLDRAAGWFYYRRESPYAKLLIDAKYSDRPRLASKLGAMCAQELMADGFFSGIDVLAPMPMHWTKQIMRGYNQAFEICRGISSVTGLPISKSLRAVRSHGVQARHTLQQRHTSLSGTLAIKDAADFAGRHVLFVDDIITTGASASEAIRTLHTAAPAAVSALCLGLTALA